MRSLGDWSIGQRLAAGFGVVVAVLAVFAAASGSWQQASARAQAAFAQRIHPLSERAADLDRAILKVAIAARASGAHAAPRHAAPALDAVAQARKALRALADAAKEPDGQAAFRDLEPSVERYLDAAESVARLGPLTSRTAAEAALSDARADAIVQLQAFADLQHEKARQAIAAMEASRDRVASGLWIAFGTVLGVLVVLGVAVTASIRSPARRLMGLARELQRGNWQPALELAPRAAAARGETTVPRDELTQIGLAFGAAAEALERRAQRLRADAEVASAASSSLDKEAVAGQALRAMAEATGAGAGCVYWRDEDSGRLLPVAARALPAPAAALEPGEGLPGRAALERRIAMLADIPPDAPTRLKLGVDEVAPRAIVAVPAMLRGEVLGVVVLASLAEFDAAATDFLQAAALQLAIGLNNVRSHERVQGLLERVQAQNEELQAQNEEIQAQAEELQAQNEEIQAQTEELQQRTSELAAADRNKNDFLGLLAHELRNPLAAIGNSVFILGRVGERSEMERQSLSVVERQMRYLTRLIDELLDVTRISRGKLTLQREPLDLRQLVRDGVNDHRGTAGNEGIVLEDALPEAPLWVDGDRTRLAQVLGNLLSNAVKFTEPGGRIDVAMHADAEAGTVRLTVRDTGAGIEPELAERLFQPFSQGDTGLVRGRGGLGLGLALSKALVALHEGKIELRSAGRGHGTEFIVTLPVCAQRPLAASEPKQAVPGGTRRVLVIEDNEDAAETLRLALAMGGHKVDVAGSGPEGVEKARAHVPDIVLCDIGIPGFDGFEVARRLRPDPRLGRTTLVAVSGYATAEDRRRSVAAGFDDHLAKPVDMQALLARVASLEPPPRHAHGVAA